MTGTVVVRIEEHDGDEIAFVDDALVRRGPDESAREAALRVVAESTTQSRRVDIHTPSGVILHVRSDPGGRLEVLGQTAAPTRPSRPRSWPERDENWPDLRGLDDDPGATPSAPSAAAAPDTPGPDDRPAPDHGATAVVDGGSTPARRGPEPAGVPRSRPAPVSARTTPRSGRAPSGRTSSPARTGHRTAAWAAGAVAAALTAVALGAGLTGHLGPDPRGSDRSLSADGATTPPAEPYPGTPPDGWGRDASWATPPVQPGVRAIATAAGDAHVVAFVTADHHLRAVTSASGATAWDVPLTSGEVRLGPTVVRIGGRPAILVHAGTRVTAHAVTDGAIVAEAQVPTAASVVVGGAAPLVRLDARRAAAMTPDGLRPVTLPAGATALSAREDGTVVAGGPAGWWALRPAAAAPAMSPWPRSPGGPTRPVAAMGSGFLVLYPAAPRPSIAVLDGSKGMAAVASGPYVAGADTTWTPSPTGTWGILGRTLVDLSAASVTDLGAWSTVAMAEDHAYGTITETLHRVGPGLRPAPVAVQTALVEATTPDGAVVRADTASGQRLWFLRRSGGQ